MTQSPSAGAPAANQFGVFEVKYPSAKQVKYIKGLVSSRVHPQTEEFATMLAALNGGTLNKRHASRMIELLISMPLVGGVSVDNAVRPAPATQKQFEFIKSLLSSKELTPPIEVEVQEAREAAMAGTLSAKTASGLIDTLKALPRKQATQAAELEAGMYRVGETVYKVYRAVHGSGQMCAKELVVTKTCEGHESLAGEHMGETVYCEGTCGSGEVEAEFVYRGLATRFVQADQRMTLEEGKQFGLIYGVCVKCAATLTKESSIAQGMGDVCASKGW